MCCKIRYNFTDKHYFDNFLKFFLCFLSVLLLDLIGVDIVELSNFLFELTFCNLFTAIFTLLLIPKLFVLLNLGRVVMYESKDFWV